ncbi:potassium channel family protein [Halovivax cerinus]|uniref:Potassium channel family protein n=1 Tax=Halovivax cerinus TaxID=1487865 RepID=A0ABD5NMU9_9EURY|nr:TrkA family potassium uptake protein [Halovivax cerinus]
MYIIVVGAGDIGTPLVDIATRSGNEVVVIEQDEERADRLAGEYDCLILNADATIKNTLQDAGADQADAIISTTDRDATNIMICLLANELEIPSVVSVVHNPDHMRLFRQVGAHTMKNPEELIAEHLYRGVARPSIVDYMRIGEQAEVFEITVEDDAPIAGRTLHEAATNDILPGDVLVVAIERNGQDPPVTPQGNTRIEPDDLLTIYAASGVTSELVQVFGYSEK